MTGSVNIFKSDGETANGYPVKLTLRMPGKSPKRFIIGHSFETQWNPKTKLPLPTHPNFDELYADILLIRSNAIKKQFKSLTDYKKAKNYLLGNAKEASDLDFYEFATEQIVYMRELKRGGNADAYRDAINQLRLVQPTLLFNDFDSGVVEQFKRVKRKTCKNSTIRTYLAEIRAIYNAGVRLYQLEDKKPFERAFVDLPVSRRRVKIRYITKASIKKLENIKDLPPSIQRTVDLTLLQFYFGGADLIDVYYIEKKHVNNGRVYFDRTKRGGLGYVLDLKVFDKAQKILDKYTDADAVYCFPWRKDKTGYKGFRRAHNRNLIKIFEDKKIEVLPLGENFSSKCVRDTFATIAKNLFIEVDLIRELMGHERTDMDNRYKDQYPQELRDEKHWEIIKTV